MNMKLGVLLDNLGPNQLALNVITNGNKVRDTDFIAFYENSAKPYISPDFAIMQAFEAWGYRGILIATSLSTASQMITFPVCKEKYFYVWDLEWIRMKEKYFKTLHSIYSNPKLKLIARSNSHKKIIEDCWNTPVVGIVDDFDLTQMNEIIKWQN